MDFPNNFQMFEPYQKFTFIPHNCTTIMSEQQWQKQANVCIGQEMGTNKCEGHTSTHNMTTTTTICWVMGK